MAPKGTNEEEGREVGDGKRKRVSEVSAPLTFAVGALLFLFGTEAEDAIDR